MFSLRALGLLGLTLLTAPAMAQTKPTPKRPATRTVSTTKPTTRAANSLRVTSDNGKGQNVYAAPGEPVNVQDNGKNTPPYDGPAAGHGAAPKGTTLPRKQ